MQSTQSTQAKERIELFKLLCALPDDNTRDTQITNYHRIIQLFTKHISENERLWPLVTDDFLSELQKSQSFSHAFNTFFTLQFSPTADMVSELQILSKDILSSSRSKVKQWIDNNPVLLEPITIEQELENAQTQIAEMRLSYEKRIADMTNEKNKLERIIQSVQDERDQACDALARSVNEIAKLKDQNTQSAKRIFDLEIEQRNNETIIFEQGEQIIRFRDQSEKACSDLRAVKLQLTQVIDSI